MVFGEQNIKANPAQEPVEFKRELKELIKNNDRWCRDQTDAQTTRQDTIDHKIAKLEKLKADGLNVDLQIIRLKGDKRHSENVVAERKAQRDKYKSRLGSTKWSAYAEAKRKERMG